MNPQHQKKQPAQIGTGTFGTSQVPTKNLREFRQAFEGDETS